MNKTTAFFVSLFTFISLCSTAHAFDLDYSGESSGVQIYIGYDGTNIVECNDATGVKTTLIAGDTLNVSSSVFGSDYDDTIFIVGEDPVYHCSSSLAKFYYSTYTMTVQGSIGNDTIHGGYGNDTLWGDATGGCSSTSTASGYADRITVDLGSDTAHGCRGNDSFFVDSQWTGTHNLLGEFGTVCVSISNLASSNAVVLTCPNNTITPTYTAVPSGVSFTYPTCGTASLVSSCP